MTNSSFQELTNRFYKAVLRIESTERKINETAKALHHVGLTTLANESNTRARELRLEALELRHTFSDIVSLVVNMTETNSKTVLEATLAGVEIGKSSGNAE
jgi:hypothetical protein